MATKHAPDAIHWQDTVADNAMLTMDEVAQWLRVHRKTIVCWRKRGILPKPRVMTQGFSRRRNVVRWRAKDIKQWLESLNNEPSAGSSE